LRIIGEVESWTGHTPEQLDAMRDGLRRLKQQGAAEIEE
jgi:rifampin ADP-ribosylating transferase